MRRPSDRPRAGVAQKLETRSGSSERTRSTTRVSKQLMPRLPLGRRLLTWMRDHAQALLSSLGKLMASPLGNLMTAGVIAIALALPSGLYMALSNVERLGVDWQGAARISLFLTASSNDADARKLAKQLRRKDSVVETRVVTQAQALEEFEAMSGFNDVLDTLDKNPLPPVILVRPESDEAADIKQLVIDLDQLPEVDMAVLDLEWVQRLFVILSIIQRGIWALAVILGVGVLLVIGNTIRLHIENRRDEIEIVKLIGGTDGFIRRPFLYSGIWYGLIGAFMAWLLVETSRWLITGPAKDLAHLYQSSFELNGLGFAGLGLLVAVGATLGWVGAWLAVGKHLRQIEPS